MRPDVQKALEVCRQAQSSLPELVVNTLVERFEKLTESNRAIVGGAVVHYAVQAGIRPSYDGHVDALVTALDYFIRQFEK